MNLLKHANAIKRRSEGSQSLARLLIGSIIALYLWLSAWRSAEADALQVAWFSLIFLCWALALHAHIRLHPESCVTRRVLAICGDLGGASLVMHMTGVHGAMMYPVYLWVIVGNGLRFGVRYLLMATAIGAGAFVLVIMYTPAWQENLTVASSLLLGMLVLPLFYASVLNELQTANKKLAEQIEETAYAATHDSLTSLPNRYLFRDRLKQQMNLAHRQHTKLAVLFVDVDRFKAINDNYGHQAGDEVLCEIGQRLRLTARASDTVARLAGDEFIVLLAGIQHESAVITAAERLLAIFRTPFPVQGHGLTVTGSIGYSLFPDHSDTLDGLIRHADQAMYQTKRNGGNNFLSYHPSHAHIPS